MSFDMTQARKDVMNTLLHISLVLSDKDKRKWILDGSGVQEAEVMIAVDYIKKAVRILGEHDHVIRYDPS